MNILQAITDAKHQLNGLTDSVQADVEILLCHVLQCNRTWLHTWPEKELTRKQIEQFNHLIGERQQHRPIAHLTGKRGFWTFELNVNETTLIPRPETELLVEAALEKIPQDAALQILDLGTGSGAIALAIALERPDCCITAVEQSSTALQIARQNKQRLELTNITFLHGDWFSPVQGNRFDIVLSNPPYIPEQDTHLIQGDVQHEPRSALSSGEDGLDDIRHIISHTPDFLTPGGWLILEHGYDQPVTIARLFEQNNYHGITQLNDLGGHTRVSMACRASSLSTNQR